MVDGNLGIGRGYSCGDCSSNPVPRNWHALVNSQSRTGILRYSRFWRFGVSDFQKDPGKVTCDERDHLINTRAAAAAFASAFLVTGLACMLPFFILGPEATVSVTWLPDIFMAAGLTTFFVHSVAILAQYGWKGEKS